MHRGPAGAGVLGIIPGSMGAKSYIVRGLGNADSFSSCSHGAGRTMSRNEARRRFGVADEAVFMQALQQPAPFEAALGEDGGRVHGL